MDVFLKTTLIVAYIFSRCLMTQGKVCSPYGNYSTLQFGDKCQYRCRCNNDDQCERDTGRCLNGCAHGWMGPGCQYRNIAPLNNGIAQYSDSSSNSSLATDGNITTCSKLEQKTWWRIDFPIVHYIVGFVLKVSQGTAIHFHVEGSNESAFNTNHLCYQHKETAVPAVLEIMCLETMTVKHARIVLLESSKTIELCEVEIYGGRYVSYRGSVTCSSQFLDWAGADAAVDGRSMRDGDSQEDVASRTCAITNKGWAEYCKLSFSTYLLLRGIYVYGRRLPQKPEYSGTCRRTAENKIKSFSIYNRISV